ncbi:MAG: hypothetical protein D6766_02515 [Verrucomicrobia bacterium]|nr:MAG: hypothetical protein D6766_02515 [Verrucomicrobiota bacterium]
MQAFMHGGLRRPGRLRPGCAAWMRLGQQLAAAALVAVHGLAAGRMESSDNADRQPANATLTTHWAASARVWHDDNPLQQRGAVAADQASAVASLGVRGRLDWQHAEPGFSSQARLQADSQWVRYAALPEESFSRHEANAAFRLENGPWRVQLEAKGRFTAGSREAPTVRSPWQIPPLGDTEARDRRRNLRLQESFEIRRDHERWVWRLVGRGKHQDFHTRHRAQPGYRNYVDRADLRAGPDVGWKAGREAVLWFGYRAGVQDQPLPPLPPFLSEANTYHRIHVGLAVGLGAGWRFEGIVGPELHLLDPKHLAPGANDVRWLPYFRAELQGRLGPATRLRLQASQEFVPSSSGRVLYRNLALRAGVEQTLGRNLSLTALGDLREFVYPRPIGRTDLGLRPELRLTWSPAPGLRILAQWRFTWAETVAPADTGRGYRRHEFGGGIEAEF